MYTIVPAPPDTQHKLKQALQDKQTGSHELGLAMLICKGTNYLRGMK